MREHIRDLVKTARIMGCDLSDLTLPHQTGSSDPDVSSNDEKEEFSVWQTVLRGDNSLLGSDNEPESDIRDNMEVGPVSGRPEESEQSGDLATDGGDAMREHTPTTDWCQSLSGAESVGSASSVPWEQRDSGDVHFSETPEVSRKDSTEQGEANIDPASSNAAGRVSTYVVVSTLVYLLLTCEK